MTLLIYSLCMVSRFSGYLIFYHQMHELGNPPTEVVGEGNMMVPNFAELGNLGQVSLSMKQGYYTDLSFIQILSKLFRFFFMKLSEIQIH